MPEIDVVVLKDGMQIHEDIDQKLLEGGPLYMNETLFFHLPSKTLVASDAYYGGYTSIAEPDWFGRVWFKCTKGTFKQPKLPIYRTARILTQGDIDKLIACAKQLVQRWDFKRIIYAHGTDFWPADPAASFLAGWEQVLAMRALRDAKKGQNAARSTKRQRTNEGGGGAGEKQGQRQTASAVVFGSEVNAEGSVRWRGLE